MRGRAIAAPFEFSRTDPVDENLLRKLLYPTRRSEIVLTEDE